MLDPDQIYLTASPHCYAEYRAYSSSSSSASTVVWAIRSCRILELQTLRICEQATHQISLSGLSNTTTSLVLIKLEDTDLLKSLHNLTVNRSRRISVVGWSRTTVASGSVNFTHASNTDSFAKIDVTSNRSGTGVKPVDRLRWELFCRSSLDYLTCQPKWSRKRNNTWVFDMNPCKKLVILVYRKQAWLFSLLDIKEPRCFLRKTRF